MTDDHMLSMALHLHGQELSLRDIASRLVITKGKKKGQHPSAVMAGKVGITTLLPPLAARRLGMCPTGMC